MFKILKRTELHPGTWRYKIEAPRIAKHRKAGQFVILRPHAQAERIPLTLVDGDPLEGWIEIIFQVVGSTTSDLAKLSEGSFILDLAGPLGKPTHIENFGHCICVGGGVGIAPLFPIIKALKLAGNQVTVLLGGRSSHHILLQDEISEWAQNILIATDDGSLGKKGFAVQVLEEQLLQGQRYDMSVVIGPVRMMQFTAQTLLNAQIPCMVSLNPIMIDGTGMCGGCRVSIGKKTQFACVDGPEFDAALVDWENLILRLGAYKTLEKNHYQEHRCQLESAQP